MACHPLTHTKVIFVSVNVVPVGIALQLRASMDMGKSVDSSMGLITCSDFSLWSFTSLFTQNKCKSNYIKRENAYIQLGDGKSTGNMGVGCVSVPKRGAKVGGGARENARARIRQRAFDKYPKLEFASC